MGDYADAGYRLQHYKITFHGDLKITGRFLKHITVHSPATIAHGNGRLMCYIETTNIVALRSRWNKRSTYL